MDSLFLLQFACFIFMLVNAFFVALSYLHVRWENKRYERSRWMIVVAFNAIPMLDKSCNGINPPTHELLILEEPSLFLSRFLGQHIADFYQIRPCDG